MDSISDAPNSSSSCREFLDFPSYSSYCPSFSDMCDDSSEFWDFIPKEEKIRKQQKAIDAQCDQMFWDFSGTSTPVCENVTLHHKISPADSLRTNSTFSSEVYSKVKHCLKIAKHITSDLEDSSSYGNRETENHSVEAGDNFWYFLKANNSGNVCERESKTEYFVEQNTNDDKGLDPEDSFWDFLKTNNLTRSTNEINNSPAAKIEELIALKQSLDAESKNVPDLHSSNSEMYNISKDENSNSLAIETEEFIALKQALSAEPKNVCGLHSEKNETDNFIDISNHQYKPNRNSFSTVEGNIGNKYGLFENKQDNYFSASVRTEKTKDTFASPVKADIVADVNEISNETPNNTTAKSRFSPCIASVYSIRECSFDIDNMSEDCLQSQSSCFKQFWGKESENCSQNVEDNLSHAEEHNFTLQSSSEKDIHDNIPSQRSNLMKDSGHRKPRKRLKTVSPFGCSQFVVKDLSTEIGSRDASELSRVFERENSQTSHNPGTDFSKESDEIILDDSCIQEAYNVYRNSSQNDNDNWNLNNVDYSIKNANQPNSFYGVLDSNSFGDNTYSTNNVYSHYNNTKTVTVSSASSRENLSSFMSAVPQSNKNNLPAVFIPVHKPSMVQEDGKCANTTPLYLIMPKSTNVSTGQNKAQLLMVINNNDTGFKNGENYGTIPNKVFSTSNSHSFERNNSSYRNIRQTQNFYPVISNDQTTIHTVTNAELNPLKENKIIKNSTVPAIIKNPNESSSFSNFLTNTALSKTSNIEMANFFDNVNNASKISLSQENSIRMKPSEPSVTYIQSRESKVLKPVKLIPEIPPQNFENNSSTHSSAIKYISLGKDKKAIQQTSIPLKLENVIQVTDLIDNSNSAAFSSNLTTPAPIILTYVTATDSYVKSLDNKVILNQQGNTKSIYAGPVSHILATGSKDTGQIFPNELKIQQNHMDTLKPTASGITSNLNTANKIPFQAVQKNLNFSPKPNNGFQAHEIAPYNTDNSKNSLTLDSLTPSVVPLSVVPVSVGHSSHSITKPLISKIIVLPNSNQPIAKQNLTVPYHSRQKMSSLKKCYMKSKKFSRKTVRELLLEQRQKDKKSTVNNTTQEQKLAKPVLRTPCDNMLLPIVTSAAKPQEKLITQTKQVQISHKRPNILILPSSIPKPGKAVSEISKGSRPGATSLSKEKDTSLDRSISESIFAVPLLAHVHSPLNGRQLTARGQRPRHYDMCELIIGCFKVQDDVDSHGRFRSKFKVLFSKRQFLYDFPVSRCNQVDLNDTSLEKMVRVIVPFKTVLAMHFNNRRINVQVSTCPLVYQGHIQARSGIVANATVYDISDSNDSFWGKSVGSSLLHKITLRKRQAEKLQTHLCLFDQRFLTLSNGSPSLKESNRIFDASPFEEDLALKNFKKLNKSKKLFIRRLPQWDCTMREDPLDRNENVSMLQSNQVCSCRISCRSVRCSCVKAAKSCRTGGSVCLCTNCDNPLNVLECLGLNLEFALSDTCLFQNIYQIPKLLTFLQRDVKLSCCNTIARIQDCIPGTVLCPNVECNVQLEFSWCRGIICYPERNPRNHCSYCGQCCFSNGRHCTVCNRCYVATSKCPSCPNCNNKKSSSAQNEEHSQNRCRVTPIFHSDLEQSAKFKNLKPEIVLLDGPMNAKSGIELQKSGEELSKLITVLEKEIVETVNSMRSAANNFENFEVKETKIDAVLEKESNSAKVSTLDKIPVSCETFATSTVWI